MGHWQRAMEGLSVNHFANIYRGKRVLVTGHTGFKGSWLALWLTQLGAKVAGFSVDIPSTPSHFSLLALENHIEHHLGDVRDRARLAEVIDAFRPEVIFHLAAQALVRESYANPATSFEVNTMGMVNLLECVRTRPWIEAAVLITSDKAYRNVEWCWGYRETDALGGYDPYGASKSCADIVAQSYFHSFFQNSPTQIAIARAGNVIGGGDWAADRIVPDCIRAWSKNETVTIRSPRATRPWQHVLEPVSGYLWLGTRLLQKPKGMSGEAFNFGPEARVNQTVGELLDAMTARWSDARWNCPEGMEQMGHEAMLLKLSCDKALHFLKWEAVLSFEETVAMTADWYHHWHTGNQNIHAYSLKQIGQYCDFAQKKGAVWL
jgi:CDP-glucose 4,6-dehydratase